MSSRPVPRDADATRHRVLGERARHSGQFLNRTLVLATSGALLATGMVVAPIAAAQATTSRTAVAASSHHHQQRGWGWHRNQTLTVWANNNADGTVDSYRLSTHWLHAGLVRIVLKNIGTEPHQAQLIRLHKGVSAKDYIDSLIKTHGATAVTLGDATGGANVVDPGGSQTTWSNLRAGNYVVLCFQSAGDHGAPHFALGMTATFTVSGWARWARPPGHVQGTISAYTIEPPAGSSAMPIMGFHMPKVIDEDGLYIFRNTAKSDTHELSLLPLAPGKTAADVVAWVRSGGIGTPPVLGDAGGAGALKPGTMEWLRMSNLKPGQYVAVCFVPDDKTGIPHVAMGMAQQFTVR